MSAGSKEVATPVDVDGVGLPPVGNALGPMPDEGKQVALPGVATKSPREVVLGDKGPIGADSVASLTPSTPPVVPKRRGRPAGTSAPRKKITAPPSPVVTAAAPCAGLRLHAQVQIELPVGRTVLDFAHSALDTTPEAFSAIVSKWRDEVKETWEEELAKTR